MNLGMENEYIEHKRSTSELREGMESVASILNKHDHGVLYFGVRPSDGEVIGQDVSEKASRRPVPPPSLRKVREKYANSTRRASVRPIWKSLPSLPSRRSYPTPMWPSAWGCLKSAQKLDAGLVTREGQGKRTRYTLSKEAMGE